MIKNIIKEFLNFYQLFNMFNIFKSFKKFNILFFCLSLFFSFSMMYYFDPTILDKFLLFEGGNDGLLYVHFAHLIVDSLVASNYIEAFRLGKMLMT